MRRAIQRIRAEFQEMPGLRLTAAQVQRLCGVEADVCKAVLAAFVDAKFLSPCAEESWRVHCFGLTDPHRAACTITREENRAGCEKDASARHLTRGPT